MTIQEFKAWLEGFSEAIGDSPTPDQWNKIKEKVKTLGYSNVRVDTPSPYRSPATPSWPNDYIVTSRGLVGTGK